jgi:hypothetical protein
VHFAANVFFSTHHLEALYRKTFKTMMKQNKFLKKEVVGVMNNQSKIGGRTSTIVPTISGVFIK